MAETLSVSKGTPKIHLPNKGLVGVKPSKKKEKDLTQKIQNIQTRYFKQESLSREKYDELMLKYEQELESVKKKQGE